MFRTYRWKLALSTVLLGGIAMFSTQGCTVTTGDGTSDGGDDFDSGDFTWDGGDAGNNNYRASCDGCVFDWCRQQWAVCQQDSDCNSIYACSIGCLRDNVANPGQCTQDCYDRYPAGKSNYRALAVCNQYYSCTQNCSSRCNRTSAYCSSLPPDVDAGGGNVPYDAAPPPTCFDCTSSRCGNEKSRCSPGSDCEAYSQCTNSCADSTSSDPLQCVDDCGLAHPGGKSDSESLSNCTQSQCRTECGF